MSQPVTESGQSPGYLFPESSHVQSMLPSRCFETRPRYRHAHVVLIDGSSNPAMLPTGPPIRLFLVILLPEPCQDAEVFERRGIAGALDARGDVAEQSSHDLAAASLGQGFREADFVRTGQGADLLGDVRSKLLPQRLAGLLAGFERDERGNACPFSSSGLPTTAASATRGWLTSALSISIVESRWPATLSTSSTRPMIQ